MMTAEAPNTERRWVGLLSGAPLLLFLMFFGLALALAPGNLGLDSQTHYEVARSILAGEGPQASGGGTVLWDANGETRSYGRFTHGQSMLFLPLELLLVAPLKSLLPDSIATKAGESIVALLFFPFFAGASMALLYVFLRAQQITCRDVLVYTCLVGIATPLLNYMSSPHEVTQVTFFLLLGLVVGVRAIQHHSPWRLFVAIHLMCLATHLRPTAALECAVLTAWLFHFSRVESRKGNPVPGFVWFAAGFVTAGIISLGAFAAFNYIRFGDLLLTGYKVFLHEHGIDTLGYSFWRGVLLPLVSLDYGWIWFCPLFAAIPFARRAGVPSPLVLLSSAAWVLFLVWVVAFARSGFFNGGPGYAPRFQAHLLPFLLLPLLAFLRNGAIPRWLLALAVLSITHQIAWKIYSPLLEISQLQQEVTAFPEMSDLAPPGRIPARWMNLWRGAAGTLEDSIVAARGRPVTEIEKTLMEPDFAWWRSWRFGRIPGAAITLACAVAFLVTLISALLLSRLYKRQP